MLFQRPFSSGVTTFITERECALLWCRKLALEDDAGSDDESEEEKHETNKFSIIVELFHNGNHKKNLPLIIKHHWPKCSVLQRHRCAPSITTNWLTWQLHHKLWRRVFWRVTYYLPMQTAPLSVVKGDWLWKWEMSFSRLNTHCETSVYTPIKEWEVERLVTTK